MKAVARLVRIDADERAARPIHGPVEALERDATKLVRERLLQTRVEPAPERQRAADDVLPESALRLVQRGRRAHAERRPLERLRDAPLVDAVTRLVHGGEERVDVALVVAAGETDIAEAECDLERMNGRV